LASYQNQIKENRLLNVPEKVQIPLANVIGSLLTGIVIIINWWRISLKSRTKETGATKNKGQLRFNSQNGFFLHKSRSARQNSCE